MTDLTPVLLLAPAVPLIAYLLAVEVLAPLDTACIHVDKVSDRERGKQTFVWDHLHRRFRLADAPEFAIDSGHVLILVQRLTRSRNSYGKVLAVVNHTTGHRHVDSKWVPVSVSLAMAAFAILGTTFATLSFPNASREVAVFWVYTVFAGVASVLILKRQLDLQAIVAAIRTDPEPFLVFDAEYSTTEGPSVGKRSD